MTIKALDKNNDIFLQNGSIHTTTDGAEVVQQVRSRLLIYLGEWFLDTTAGVDYFNSIFIKPVNLNLVESIIKTVIIDTDNVEELTVFELAFNKASRKMEIDFEAITTFGEIIKSEVTINA